MLSIDKIIPLRKQLAEWRKTGNSIALVPTMGNLHAGHLSLIEKAKQIAGRTVVTIFVNPAQFVQGEDYASYPRTLAQDQELLSAANVDLLFHPAVGEIYQEDWEKQTRIMVPALDNILCGKFRPGHFAGVASVVARLFNITTPDVALFGEKDYQQLLVIKQLVRDLYLPVRVIGMPTVREADGLAMSSRNAYLDSEERKQAPVLFQVLNGVGSGIINGSNAYSRLEEDAVKTLNQAGLATEYVAIRDAESLDQPGTGDLVVLAAVRIGKTRLIDNVIIRR